MNMNIWIVGALNQLFIKRFLNWNNIFKKIKQSLAKLRSLWKVHFALPILICLNIDFWPDSFAWYDAFSILLVSTKNRFSSFFKKSFRFPENLLQSKVLKTFIISSNCHIKRVDLLNGELFWKFLVPFFRRTYVLSVGFKLKPLRKKTKNKQKDKNQLKFCRKNLLKGQPLIFTIHLMNHLF